MPCALQSLVLFTDGEERKKEKRKTGKETEFSVVWLSQCSPQTRLAKRGYTLVINRRAYQKFIVHLGFL